MAINICIPTLNSFDTLIKLCATIVQQSELPDSVIILDNSAGKLPILDIDEQFNGSSVTPIHIRSPKNLGVAASWNLFMRQFANDINIIMNDDLMLHVDCVKHIMDSYKASEGQHLHYPMKGAGAGNAFSCFLLAQSSFRKIGPFDETFYPAYFEDNDYSWRMRLQNEQLIPVWEAEYTHVGSSTMKKYTPEQTQYHHDRFSANAAYFSSKWGGPPHSERFTTPFGV